MKVKIFITLLLISTLFLGSIQIKAQCDIKDWTVLKALYESTNGDSWANKTGWEIVKAGNPPPNCNLALLHGIKLNDGRIYEIKLPENNLNGTIPGQIGELLNLIDLTFNGNNLSGTIPATLGNLPKLEWLILWNNQLEGQIPTELGGISSLKGLSLNDNKLTGSIPNELGNLNSLQALFLGNNRLEEEIPSTLGQLINLTKLRIENNQLTGGIPSTLGNLLNLIDLSLHSNKLSGPIPATLGNLSKLEWLGLGSNQLEGQIPIELGGMSSLKGLYFDNNYLTGSIPGTFGNLTRLQEVHLNNNLLDGEIPSTFGQLTDITKIRLEYNQLSGSIPSELGNLSNLTDLNLYKNKFSGPIPAALGDLSKLEWLSLGNNQLEGEIPIELGEIESLKGLGLSNNNLKGSLPEELGSLENLQTLFLGNNRLEGEIPVTLGQLTNLTKLRLDKNQLSGVIPSELGNLKELIDLSVHNNLLSGTIPAALGDLSKLVWLSLGNNQLEGEIPIELGEIDSLKHLSLAENNISGSIPAELSKLENLLLLNLGGNLLEGEIPFELGQQLTKLTKLDLDDNNLTGPIPPTIGMLDSLKRLSLWSNQLSGSIPTTIGNLSKLDTLSLWNNKLSGKIPIELYKLTALKHLGLGENSFSGNISDSIKHLTNLVTLYLTNNQLSGPIPEGLCSLIQLEELGLSYNYFDGTIPNCLSNIPSLKELWLNSNSLSGNIPTGLNRDDLDLNIKNNYFNCEELDAFLAVLDNISYAPQRYEPENYDDIKSQLYDTLAQVTLEVALPWSPTGNVSYQWYKNEEVVPNANQATHVIPSIQPGNAGVYNLHVYIENCLGEPGTIKFVSKPIILHVRGYDLTGQPIEYTELMIEFEDKAVKQYYEENVFSQNVIWKDKCDCNRELHLYDFAGDEESFLEVYRTILDQRLASVDVPDNDIDGGFNYKLNDANFGGRVGSVYQVSPDYLESSYPDQSIVYLLDSGLDRSTIGSASDYLMPVTPIEACYNLSASGYNFTTEYEIVDNETITIDDNYIDNVGHGTFGYTIISDGLEGAANTKIVPIKITDTVNGGNIFDLICGLYHAIDNNAADVINISAGYNGGPIGILEDAIYEAKQKGIFIVVSAGNDGLNFDTSDTIQYPAFYANDEKLVYNDTLSRFDTIPYNHLISVAALDVENQLWEKSNRSSKSVTIAAPGVNLFGYDLNGAIISGSGTSYAAFFTSGILAREIARDKNRSLDTILKEFEARYLVENPNLVDKTSTGKQIKFSWKPMNIITVTKPVTGYIFSQGDEINIKWTDNNSDFVIIRLYKDNSLWSTIKNITDNDGIHKYSIPSSAPDGQYKIYMQSITTPSIVNYSDYFTIQTPSSNCNDSIQNGTETGIDCGGSMCSPCLHTLTVTKPETGDIYSQKDIMNIQWIDNNSDFVIIKLYKDNSLWYTIFNITANDGIHKYSIPSSIPDGQYKIYMQSITTPSIVNYSDYFTIKASSSYCNDGIQNGNETGIDCGGNCSRTCNSRLSSDDSIAIHNYPNPFKDKTTISYTLKEESKVSVIIYNVWGEQIDVLIDNELQSVGNNTTTFNGSNYPAGIYYYRIQCKDYNYSSKMILTK